MRIALYHNLHSGGARRVVEAQAQRLALAHKVALFGLHTGLQPHALRQLPLARRPFGRINPLLRAADLLRLDAFSKRIAAMIDSHGFDVVLVHPCQITQAPLLLRWLHTPALYFCHELPRQHYEARPQRPYDKGSRYGALADRVDPLPRLYRALMRIVDRVSVRGAAAIVVNSRYIQRNVSSAYGRESQLCYEGVDSAAFAPAAGRRERLVLSVGALTPLKGFDFLVEALATLPEGGRPRLLIISNYQEANELAYLQQLAVARGVALELRAAVPEANLQEAYARAGCFAYAPHWEPFGLVALEAMAAGAPVVAVAEGGVAETVLHGETGLVAPREPAAFGRAVQQLIEAPEQAAALAQAARRRVQEYWTWERHVAELELLLARAAGERRAYAAV